MPEPTDPPDTSRGFWQWVKTPRLRKRAERERADEEAELAAFDPDRVPPAVIDRLVENLLRQELYWPATAKFEKLGRRAVPALLRALTNPRYVRPYKAKEPWSRPLGAVLRLLDDSAPPEMAGRVIELATHPEAEVRERAATSLGNLASPAVLTAWLAASRDPVDKVRCGAVWGVGSALTAGRVAPAFAAGAVGRIAELLDDTEDYSIAQGAAEALIRLDPDRARAEFLAPERFSAGNRRLDDLLKAADERDFPLPPDRVIRLLDELRPQAGGYSASRSVGFLLLQLARQRTPDAAAWAERAAGWATPGSDGAREVGQSAAQALATLGGVTEPVNVVLARLAAGEPLSPEQQAFHVAWLLNAEVCNGGFAQYFANSSGGTAGDAAAGFEAIGAPAHAALVRRAVDLFGAAGPAVDRDRRHEQLAALPPASDAELDRLSTEYYRTPGDIPTLLTAFAGRHPDQFRTGS